ncbi:MAG: hypothetical protein COT45_04875 [bacterium (Candidatus Stahlbacteria) CG08_land_8_20_14_0_20_40_26]|nr:MAG: hypothetical protein COX49_03635 [bacterium (Candidatus Stahlbacteria) CG23_combo_of_CG06-09_8_20_14_all_40_9]PIS23961.1 MAG: hypothetical protein COT45_04875 [bacterium (Candidatus Stahlbacteria) CG08_land_8_20_14_0_20_40_26]
MKNTLKVINELREKGLIKDYAIGGGIGTLRWVEPFFTRDLDIFIILAQESKDKKLINLSPIYDYLKSKGYNEWIGQWLIIEGIPVEFIPAFGLAKESVENAIETNFEGVKTKVMTPEYLISLLLKASRDKDKIKIKMLLEQTRIDMEKLKALLTKYNLNDAFKGFINKT